MGRSQVAETPDKRSKMGGNELYYHCRIIILITITSMEKSKRCVGSQVAAAPDKRSQKGSNENIISTCLLF
jgi:hypothetical protein